ncbi:MAG: hypothetical protein AABX73_04545 [Nanoarchaeota archaeon]
MADKEQVIQEKVEQDGLMDFPALYSYAHSIFKEELYGIDEEKYIEKITGNKRDITIEWKATKQLSDYFRIEDKIKFEIKNMTDVEVEIDGAKKKMNKGQITIDIKGIVVKDFDSKWEKSPFTRFTRDVYNKYIIPSRVRDTKEKIKLDIITFKEKIKAFLELSGRR